MTDQKSWLWRKKPSGKTIVDAPSKESEDEVHLLIAEKAVLERDLKDLSDKLSSSITECNAKDDLAKKNAKTAQEALAGWEKAESKALSLKQELDEALKQRETCEDRIHHLDAALKECMQQLRFVREHQEQTIHDVMLKASEELEEMKMMLEEKLVESGKKIAKLAAENSHLNEVLLLKDQLIGELNQQMIKAQDNMESLMGKLDNLEKDNNSLLYEVRVLEKEVDIRNEEREFNRRASEAAHKQHLENVKKIAKLESECQRLRVLVKKRLPGPAALAKMKSEVDMLQSDPLGNRRRKSNSNLSNVQLSYAEDSYPESPSKQIHLLTEKICTLEEENNCLKETLKKKMNELQMSRHMYVQTASKLSLVETPFEESPKGQIISDATRSSAVSHDVSLATLSDVGSDDKVSCTGSWASALISELDQFRDEKDKVSPSKPVGRSDINNLMNDFLEMEKLALVCVDESVENSSILKTESNLDTVSESIGKELVPITSLDDDNNVTMSGLKKLPSNLSLSISKLIEIIEGINLPSQDCDAPQSPSAKNKNHFGPKILEISTDYLVRVFQWKTSELAAVLHNFLRTCDDLLHGRVDYENFTRELTAALEWLINHCFSLQDVSSMKDALRKQFNWDETRSESEIETGMSAISQFSEADKLSKPKELLLSAPSSTTNGYHHEMDLGTGLGGGKVENSGKSISYVKHELELLSAAHNCESLNNQLQKSETTIQSLQAEVKTLTDLKVTIEDQFENHKMTIEDLNSHLKAVKSELDEAYQKIDSLEAELKNKLRFSEEMESKCLYLQLQLDRENKTDTTEHVNQNEKQQRNELELSAASEKLAACQETILHLGKQLRALASSQDAVVSDKFISTPTNTNPGEKKLTSSRSSLLDQMQAEDDAVTEQFESPETKEILCAKNFSYGLVKEHIAGSGVKMNRNETFVGSLAIVPSKKTSSGLFKKLLWRRKKSSSKKLLVPFTA